ncbi:SCO2400 family protein [Streptomyces sp. NPDC054802]
MDYCSTCRRHLNGALVCPGCGAYAPDIAPPPVLSAATAPAAAPAAEPYDFEEAPAAPPTAPAPAPTPAGPSGEGRAARRRPRGRRA